MGGASTPVVLLELGAFEPEALAVFDAAGTENEADAAFASEKEAGDQDSGRFLAAPSLKAAAATSASAAAAMLDVFFGRPVGAASDFEGSMGASLCLFHDLSVAAPRCW